VEALRRRLARSDARRILLELPDGWWELDNLARLRLLQRQALIRRQELALITRHLETRKAAQQLGIPVFSSLDAAARRPEWRMDPPLPLVDPRHPERGLPEPPPWRATVDGPGATPEVIRQAARPNLHKARQKRIQAEQRYRRPAPLWLRVAGYSIFGLLILALLAGFTLFILPAATVTVVPGQREAAVTVELTGQPGLLVPDPIQGLVPARLVETYLELTGSIPTSGREQRPAEKATGQVVFTNLGRQTVRIPAGTILSTSTGERVEFRTTEPAELPGPPGTRVTVPIEALEPGIQGNVRGNTITTVSGGLNFQVQVTNPEPTGGGRSDLVAVVKQEDKDALLDQLYAQAQAQAPEKLQAELHGDEWLPPASVRTFIVAQFFDRFNDEPAEELNLTLRVLAQGVAVDQEATQELAFQALEDSVPERAKLVADSIVYLVDPAVEMNGQAVNFRVTARGNYVIPIDVREMRSAIAGLTPEEAAQVLHQRWLLAGEPQFYLDPSWKKSLPSIPTRIQVRVEYATPGQP